MVYSFNIPASILESIESNELRLDDIMYPAISDGLRKLEKALKNDPSQDTFTIHRYNERTGYNEIWKGSTKHTLIKTTLSISKDAFTRTINIISECNEREIDHRQLYWTVLIKPYVPKGTSQLYKEQMQSNQLPHKAMTTMLVLCLQSYLLHYEDRPKEQTTLEGV